MINQELLDIADEKANVDAQKYVKDFFRKINGIFNSGFNVDEYASKIYSLLKYEKYDDYRIKSGKCDKVIFKYLASYEFNPEFSDAFKNAFAYVHEKVSKIYDTEIKIAREKEQTGSMFYKYYIGPNDKKTMSIEIIIEAMKRNISDEDLNHFIVDYINMDRTKSFSVSKKQAFKAEIEAISNSKKMDPEDIKKFIIAMAILFGICWISKLSFEAKEHKEQNNSNKPTQSYSYKGTSSSSEDYYGIYDLDKNEYVIGGEEVARL